MHTIKKLAMAAAAAAIGIGISAGSASAYALSGGSYTAVALSFPTASVGGGAYAVDCQTTAFSGWATGGATTTFTARQDDCSHFGLPAMITQSGAWELTVVGGPDSSGWYAARVDVPAGASSTTAIPLAGCTVTVTGAQSFVHGVGGNIIRVRNNASGIDVEVGLYGMAYATSGCPFANGSDLEYQSNGFISVPGVTVS